MRFGLREIMFLLVLVAVPVAAYFFVFQPRSLEIAQAREEIQRKQDRLRLLENTTQGAGALSEQIDKLETVIEEHRQQLPDAALIDEIIRQVTEVAEAYRLRTRSIRNKDTNITPHWAERQMRVVITGDFDGFYQFLVDLENMPRLTKISDLTIERLKDTDATDGEMKADFVLSIFFENNG